METRYKIFTLFARALIACAEETASGFSRFHLNRDATQRVIKHGAPLLQNDCALFYQIMKKLHAADGVPVPKSTIIPELSDQIVYIDFSGIFDRRAEQKYLDRQKRAEAMFRLEGVTLDLGSGPASYVAFECSSGTRIENVEITKPHRVIVVDNPGYTTFNTKVITVEGEFVSDGEKRYHRTECSWPLKKQTLY